MFALTDPVESAYVYPFWVLDGATVCEPLERYRCLWNAGNRLYTRFFAKVFKDEKKMMIGIPEMMHFIRLFDGFAETGILMRMIDAAMKIFTALMDPKQKHKFPITNIWDVGSKVEEDINHWFNMNIIFQGRRNWFSLRC